MGGTSLYCTNCGTKLDEEARFCHNCGHDVQEEKTDSVNLEVAAPENTSPETEHNVVEHQEDHAKKADTGNLEATILLNTNPAPEDVELENHNNELTRLYIGEKKADFYFKKWDKKPNTWNWSAFFLSFFWLGYRRMYKPVILIFGFLFLYVLITTIFDLNVDSISSAIGIGLSVGIGLSGNQLYQSHVKKAIEKLQKEGRNAEQVKNKLLIDGGGSWKGVFAAFGIFVIYLGLSMAVIFFVPTINSSSETAGEETETPATTEEVETDVEEKEEEESVSEEDKLKEEITDLLHDNLRALEEEDIEKYMSMIYKSADETLYNQTKEVLQISFEGFDLSYEITDIEFLSVSGQAIRARVSQTTKLVKGDRLNFQDNEMIMVHTFRQQDGQWKFYNSVTEDIRYLNEVPATEELHNPQNSSASDLVTLHAPDMFDFEVSEYVDVNGDGVDEVVTLMGGPEESSEYMNTNVEIGVAFQDGSIPIQTYAQNSPTLYLYDIDQDGWKDLFYETGNEEIIVEVYRFTSEGLQFAELLDGSVIDFKPFEVTTTSGTHTIDQSIEVTYQNNQTEELFQQSCLSCHASSASAPSLDQIGTKLSANEIKDIIQNGRGLMTPADITDEQASMIAEWLVSQS